MALGLAACASQQKAPIDDAYYWPDQSMQHAPHATENNPASFPIEEGQGGTSATIEYTNVQDTTVTIRIKR